eukprot:23611_5
MYHQVELYYVGPGHDVSKFQKRLVKVELERAFPMTMANQIAQRYTTPHATESSIKVSDWPSGGTGGKTTIGTMKLSPQEHRSSPLV